MSRTSVRLLHAGHPDDDDRAAARPARSGRVRCSGGALWTSLPLYWLPAHRAGGAARGRTDGCSMSRIIGARLPRNEDARLLTGRAQFVDDVDLNGMLHVAFRRSEYAHALLKGVDVSAARAREGVVAIYTASDLGDYWRPGPL